MDLLNEADPPENCEDQSSVQPQPGTPLAARTRMFPTFSWPSDIKQEPHSAASLTADQTHESRLGKRQRADEDAFSEALSPLRAVSKRATPDPAVQRLAPIMSRASSKSSSGLGFEEIDSETWAQVLGYDPKQERKRFKSEQEQALDFFGRDSTDAERRLQERADEEFARKLQEDLNNEDLGLSHAQHISGPTRLPSTQSYFDSSGAYQRPVAPVPPRSLGNTSFLQGQIPGAYSDDKVPPKAYASPSQSTALGPTSLGHDNDELQIIDPPKHKFSLSNRLHSSRQLYQDQLRQPSGNSSLETIDLTKPYHTASFGPSQGLNASSATMDPFRPQTSFGFRSGASDVYSTMSGMNHPFNDTIMDYNAGRSNQNYMSSTPVWQTHMTWGMSDEESNWGSLTSFNSHDNYGLGNYGGGADNPEALKDLLSNIRPDEESLGAAERGTGTPEGMAESANLYNYQQKGLSWLIKMEEGTNKGCILADDMGLGKTIQAIALLVRRRSQDPRRKTTLIIAPVALIRQWEAEIASKVKPSHRLETFVYHGSGKTKTTWEHLCQFDIVISTYGTLTADYKKKLELAKRKADHSDYVPETNDRPVLTGDDCKFFRCILDEAQNIKNKAAKSAIAAYEVNAEFRLCLTGTPMMNNVVELYSLVHFLRIQPYCQWEKFNVDFARPLRAFSSHGRAKAMRKLQALCKAIMLRRTKNSKIDGKPLIVLPDRRTASVDAVFDDDERAFYSALEAKTQLTFNKFLKAGSVGRNYSNVLTLLLRLRQACCHPHLIKDFAITIDATPETLLENARELPQLVIDRIIENGITDCPVCMDTADNYTIFNPCGHSTCPECFCGLSDVLRNPNATSIDGNSANARFRCHTCRGEIDSGKVTDYMHFKKIHEPRKAAAEGLIDEADISTDSANSDGEEDIQKEIIPEDDSDSESLKDFVVDDDASIAKVDSADSDSEDLNESKPLTNGSRRERSLKQGSSIVFEDKVQDSLENAKLPNRLDDIEDFDLLEPAKYTSIKGDDKSKHEEKQPDNASRRSLILRPSLPASGNLNDNISKSGYSDGRNPFEKASISRHAKRAEKKNNKQKGKKPGHKSLAQLKKEGMRNVASRKEYFRRLAKDFIPSAKIKKCMDILAGVMESPEHEKTIIFSQFTSLLDLLEIPINHRRWSYRRYDGSMDANSRNRSVVDFTGDPRTRILLVSLKAGNAGLNLTAASQVIILDPFWNPYIEEQAIDRAHRIGQRRTVQIHRILIPETVEDRILQLQNKKRELIEGALDEGANNSIGRLGVQELAFLFGIPN